MKLSFVIPAYNEECYINDCLSSIIDQTKKCFYQCEIEIIVVNNASTDNTKQIASSYPNVIVVDEPRKGLTYARQAGYEASTGDLIANVDADCRLTDGWIDRVIKTFLIEKNLAALSGPFIYYDITASKRFFIGIFYSTAFITYVINRYILRVGSMVQGGNFIINRKHLEKIGGFNLDISFYGEDTDIARRLHEVGNVIFTYKLKMFSSARRLKHEGILTMAWKYSINYLWTIFMKKPFDDKYIDIRENL